ncbi:hypothetical protein AV530_011325 [Patagioenas fasciata monilis]|uniref:Uncharacterized protein n=1 Tax=Patagioenas fasciata monilis TaxID=372326 RepID=A0A1V4KNZ5_PATFA|nr:hypothetical protein AV530_011325 [Patagioenas fasciata monilis]
MMTVMAEPQARSAAGRQRQAAGRTRCPGSGCRSRENSAGNGFGCIKSFQLGLSPICTFRSFFSQNVVTKLEMSHIKPSGSRLPCLSGPSTAEPGKISARDSQSARPPPNNSAANKLHPESRAVVPARVCRRSSFQWLCHGEIQLRKSQCSSDLCAEV